MKYVLMILLLLPLFGCSISPPEDFIIVDTYTDNAILRRGSLASKWITVVKRSRTGQRYELIGKHGMVGDHITACVGQELFEDERAYPAC